MTRGHPGVSLDIDSRQNANVAMIRAIVLN